MSDKLYYAYYDFIELFWLNWQILDQNSPVDTEERLWLQTGNRNQRIESWYTSAK